MHNKSFCYSCTAAEAFLGGGAGRQLDLSLKGLARKALANPFNLTDEPRRYACGVAPQPRVLHRDA
jgi:hypothetical protein